MKMTVRNDLPGYDRDAIPGAGHVLEVFLDGVLQRLVETVDTERGFIDVLGDIVTYPTRQRQRHRLFGKVEAVFSRRSA